MKNRSLSLNHWRYSLLHFTFGVEQPLSMSRVDLPRFLYSNFCPLFHLTNLLVLLLPLTILLKGMAIVELFLIRLCSVCFTYVYNLLPHIEIPKYKYVRTQNDDITYIRIICTSRFSSGGWYWDDFKSFWNKKGHRLNFLSKEEAELKFNEFRQLFLDREKAAEDWYSLQTERIILLVNFSINLFKFSPIVLIPLMLYGLYLFTLPASYIVLGFLAWVLAGIAAYWLTGVGFLVLLGTVALVVTLFNWLCENYGVVVLGKIAEVFYLVWVFVKELYDSQCPKITIEDWLGKTPDPS